MEKRQREQFHEVVSRYQAGRIDRRQAIQLLGALGLTGFAASAAGGRAAARLQDQGTPPPMATPAVGPRADGTNLWKVQVGGSDMENRIDLQAFFPGEITINAGDAIWFQFAPMGMPLFHTVTFTSGAELPPLFVPDMVDGTPVASPEGPPRLLINPELAFPTDRDTYDGTGLVNSGLDVLRMDLGPYVLTFTAPGAYDFECAVHGIVMKGTVTVQEAGATLPHDAAAYETMAQDQMAALIEEGKAAIAAIGQAAASPVAAGPTTWEVAAGAGGQSQARVMRFLPEQITIKVNDTVRWTDMTVGEPHTVTFLGGTEPPEDTLIEPQASGQPKFIQNYQTFLPSGGSTFDGTGYHNSGFLGLPPEIGTMFGLLGDSYELTFTAAGEYPYYCILHSGGPDDANGMTGKVVVEA